MKKTTVKKTAATSVVTGTEEHLKSALKSSWYMIIGVDVPLEWAEGYDGLLEEAGAGTASWHVFTGDQINRFIQRKRNRVLSPEGHLPADTLVLMSPLDGFNPVKIPIFKVRMQDRWFDDFVSNTR